MKRQRFVIVDRLRDLADLKREPEAEACFRKALELDRDFPGAHYNLGYLQLLRGQFAEGWRGRQARSDSSRPLPEDEDQNDDNDD